MQTKFEANISSGSYILGSIDNKAAVGFPCPGLSAEWTSSRCTGNCGPIYPGTQMQLNVLPTSGTVIAEIKSKVEATENGWLASGDNFLADFTSASAAGTDVGSSLGQS